MPAAGAEVTNWSPGFMSQETPNSGNDGNFPFDYGYVARKS